VAPHQPELAFSHDANQEFTCASSHSLHSLHTCVMSDTTTAVCQPRPLLAAPPQVLLFDMERCRVKWSTEGHTETILSVNVAALKTCAANVHLCPCSLDAWQGSLYLLMSVFCHFILLAAGSRLHHMTPICWQPAGQSETLQCKLLPVTHLWHARPWRAACNHKAFSLALLALQL
jgi:hypothetical protein